MRRETHDVLVAGHDFALDALVLGPSGVGALLMAEERQAVNADGCTRKETFLHRELAALAQTFLQSDVRARDAPDLPTHT